MRGEPLVHQPAIFKNPVKHNTDHRDTHHALHKDLREALVKALRQPLHQAIQRSVSRRLEILTKLKTPMIKTP